MPIKRTIKTRYITENPICKVREDEVELDNGKIESRIILETTPGCCIFAITKDNEVLLVKNKSYVHDKFLLELPAGYIDKKESKEEAAKRELLEETGYESEKLEYIGEIYVKPGRTNKITHSFLARNVMEVSKQKLDESEDVKVIKVKVDKLIEMIEKNEFKTSDMLATTLLALLKLKEIK